MPDSVTPDPGKVAHLYDSISWAFQRTWDDNFHFGYWDGPEDPSTVAEATDRLTDLMIDALRVGPGDLVLDVGCGTGKPAVRLHRRTGADVLGVTVSEQQVAMARARAESEGVLDAVRFEQADAMRLPYDDASFDAVLALESIVYMDRTLALAEFARVVRPGGPVALTDLLVPPPVNGVPWQAPEIQQVHRALPIPATEDYRSLCAQAGLEIVVLADISAFTRYSVPKMREEIFRQREDMLRDEAALVRRFGESGLSTIQAMLARPENITEYGYLYLVART